MPFLINKQMENKLQEQKEHFEKEYHFASLDDTTLGVETAIYKNGNQVKRFKISTGQEVIVRELSGGDMMKIDAMVGADAENYFPALLHHAVKIDGKQLPMESFADLKGKDYNKIKVQALTINF